MSRDDQARNTVNPHPRPTLYVLVGLPGSGKTTRAVTGVSELLPNPEALRVEVRGDHGLDRPAGRPVHCRAAHVAADSLALLASLEVSSAREAAGGG